MEREFLTRLIVSAASAAVFYLVYHALKLSARRTMLRKGLALSRYIIVKKVLSAVTGLIALLIIVYVWGFEIRNIWVYLTGLITMVAIAFFAVWSLIGNILAGVLLYFTSPFKLDDTVEIHPDGVRGKVIAINTFFTLLKDEEGNYINIPNSLMFQKYLKVRERSKAPPGSPG